MTERESADWAKTPEATVEFYESLTFMEQAALAWVIEKHKENARLAMQETLASLRAQYGSAEVE